MQGFHQHALMEFPPTRELARLTGLEVEEVLDILLSPTWRTIRDSDYAEAITWSQANTLTDEWRKAK